MLKIIVDEHIAFGDVAFGQFGEIHLLPAAKITAAILGDADALIVRSTVRVDERLLKNSTIQFVGTATIGTDHIDTSFLKSAGITFANAAGCNADAVAEHVFAAIAQLAIERGMQLGELTIGVIGVGNVGSRVVRLAQACGLQVLKNDPPLERRQAGENFIELDALMQADIITLHVPLIRSGQDQTFHLFAAGRLAKLREDVLLINTCRGAVIDNTALLRWKKEHAGAALVLDVWENEPDIDVDLLRHTDIATPHIAGYSLEGKANGTKIIHDIFCRHFDFTPDWVPRLPEVEQPNLTIRADAGIENALYEALTPISGLKKTDARMRLLYEFTPEQRMELFNEMRKGYPLRREFFNYTLRLEPMNINLALMLNTFRFQLAY